MFSYLKFSISTFFRNKSSFRPLFLWCRFLNSIRNIMSGPLFYTLSSCIACNAIELFALDETIRRKEFDTTITVTATALLIEIAMVYILAHYSEKVTDHFSEVVEFVYIDLLWYNLTTAQQKCLVLPILREKKGFRLDGYGIFYCSMETFLAVCFFYILISWWQIMVVHLSFWIKPRRNLLFLSFFFLQIMRASISYFIIMRQLSG